MSRFLLRRCAHGVLVLWLVSLGVFALFWLAPGDPARALAGRQASAETVAAVRRTLGLDQAVPAQYARFATAALRGDLGHSYHNDEPVAALLAGALPVTASLALGAAVLWLALGVPAGALAARRPGSFLDRATTAVALLLHSTPAFLLGLLLLYGLFYRLRLAGVDAFPPGGYRPLTADPAQWARHLALPWATLAAVQAATYARLTRGALRDVLAEDYVRTARAKGATERRVTVTHGLRAALGPVLTQFGVDLGAVLGGVVVVETVFGLPGLGRLAVTSVATQDRPVIIGVVLLGAAAVVLASLAVDAAYAALDPRVRRP